MNSLAVSTQVYPVTPGGICSFRGLVPVRRNIYVVPPSPNARELSFINDVRDSLVTIGSRPLGQRLLHELERSDCSILIFYRRGGGSASGSFTVDPDCVERGRIEIYFDFHDSTKVLGTDLTAIETPSFTLFAHELIHAYHMAYDRYKNTAFCADRHEACLWTNDEEKDTIQGMLPHDPDEITENGIRREHGLPIRGAHVAFGGPYVDYASQDGTCRCTIL